MLVALALMESGMKYEDAVEHIRTWVKSSAVLKVWPAWYDADQTVSSDAISSLKYFFFWKIAISQIEYFG